jgi:hypothetical protein
MKYSDVVSWIAVIFSIPIVIAKFILLAIPTLTFVIASKLNCNTFANLNLKLLLKISKVFNIIEKYWIYLISIIFHPVKSYTNYKNNKKIIEFLRENVNNKEVKYEQLPENVRNAIEKEGFVEVVIKMLAMFSFLPTYRHAFLNNPFLFEYELYLTNQESPEFKNIEKMSKIIYSYITNPCYILEIERNNDDIINIDDVGFTPNYFNDPHDNIINYDNAGLQVAKYYTTFIYLETINKSPEELLKSIQNDNCNLSIMNKNHDIYQNIKNVDIKINHHVNFCDKKRYQILDLIVPYDSLYHVVSGKVEANVQNNNIVEHPMLCLYHKGVIMVYTWNFIDDLFKNRVLKYLHSLE